MMLGITLIEIPYWWSYDPNDVLATIYQHRPDLFDNQPPYLGSPIPSQPPPKRKYTHKKVNPT